MHIIRGFPDLRGLIGRLSTIQRPRPKLQQTKSVNTKSSALFTFSNDNLSRQFDTPHNSEYTFSSFVRDQGLLEKLKNAGCDSGPSLMLEW